MATAQPQIVTAAAHRPSRLGALWRSAIGRKALMAVTGLVLFVYVLVHMLANLQAFEGPGPLDRYGERLRVFPTLLWTARGVLLVAALVHVVAGIELWAERRRSRPVDYRDYAPTGSTPAARTMIWSGVLILGFLVYHLLDLTFGVANPDFRPGAILHNVVASFGRAAAAGFYVVAVVGLGFHLWHGLYASLSSLGLSNRAFTPGVRRVAAAFGTILAVGFSAVPLAVLFGLIR
jgi:succinate dehydrogenase / fumarate reductase cytochrome b subunit